MPVGIYVRVSTEEQARDGFSIAAQRNKLMSFCEFNDWDNYKFYVDEGISAKDTNRPELQKMLEDIKNGLIDIVLVYRLDRLTRSVLDLYTLLDLFDKYNCKFKSATEVYDTTTAMGKLFITLVASMAQWERENLGERISMGMQQKAKEGKYVSNLAPIGYDLDGKDSLKINPVEAEIVKEIFNMYTEQRYGIEKIARILNDRNILTKAGKKWFKNPIAFILNNPVYVGRYRYNYTVNKEDYFEVDANIEKIISDEQFEEVKRIKNAKKNEYPRSSIGNHYFISVVFCSKCGNKLLGNSSGTVRSKNKSYRYVCPNHTRGVCEQKPIFQNYLEIQFLKKIDEWIISEEVISKAKPKKEEKNNDKEIKRLYKELENIEVRRKKWQYAWVNELISDDDFKQRNEDENNNEISIKDRINKLEKDGNTVDLTEYTLKFVKNLRENWEEMNNVEKKRFVELAVKKMVIEKKNILRKPESVEILSLEFN